MSEYTEGKLTQNGLTLFINGRGVIARCPTPNDGGVFECVMNAAELVRRWNCHEELVKACDNLTTIAQEIGLTDDQNMRDKLAYAVVEAEAALAQSKTSVVPSK